MPVDTNIDVRPTDEAPSLHSVLDEALERAVAPAPAAPTTPDGPSPGTESKPAGDSGQPNRDPFGRFAPKVDGDKLTAAPGDAAAKAPTAPGTPPADATPAPGAAPVKPEDQAPASWKAEQKAHWEKIPGEVRGYIHERERQLQAGFQQVAQRANVAEAVLNEFQPYAETLQAEGATPVSAIRTLLQTAHALRTAGPEYKKAILYSLAEQYGVDLSSGLNPDLARAQAEATMLSTERLYGQTAQQMAMQQQVASQFYAFANDPANEFFPQVREIMGHLIANNVAQDLPGAYQMALGMHPEVRNILMQRHAAALRQQNEQAASVANLSVAGAPGGGSGGTKPAPKDLRSAIEQAMGG
jgi:hypothetical protein